jgi:hypothetical protein
MAVSTQALVFITLAVVALMLLPMLVLKRDVTVAPIRQRVGPKLQRPSATEKTASEPQASNECPCLVCRLLLLLVVVVVVAVGVARRVVVAHRTKKK